MIELRWMRSLRPVLRGGGKTLLASTLLALALCLSLGCRSSKTATKKDDFFTSGSREADQRASQTMAKSEQLHGSGEGSGEKNVKKAVVNSEKKEGPDQAAQAEGKLALFDRLGGQQGVARIVDDFTPRVLNDPRVDWEGKNVQRGWLATLRRGKAPAPWQATDENVASLKKHMEQFIALATGGPTQYEGKEMKSTHAAMNISNPQFDAALGDLKASLDKLQIPNKEQKELLSVIESTRPQIVTQR